MKKGALGIMISSAMGIPEAEQFASVADAGFDSVFTIWKDAHTLADHKRLADESGLILHSVHGPFSGDTFLTHMWSHGEAGKAVAKNIIKIVEACSENEVGMLVTHVHSGFEYDLPTVDQAPFAIENFGLIAERARELGVTLALENIENFELNEVLLEAFGGHPNVGFCWDSGHERCYYNGRDLLKNAGKHLIAVHLHDNMGCGSADGSIASRDDMHMLPFDGIIDWQGVADRLDSHGYDGTLMLEVKRSVWYSDRPEIAGYMKMSPSEYIAEAYKRAKRLLKLRKA